MKGDFDHNYSTSAVHCESESISPNCNKTNTALNAGVSRNARQRMTPAATSSQSLGLSTGQVSKWEARG